MKQIKNTMNAIAFPKEYEKNELPSCTLPDQTLPIRTILERYARGLPIDGVQKQGTYHFDSQGNQINEVLPDPKRLDLAELEAYRKMYQQELNDLRNRAVSSKQSAPTGPLEPTENSNTPTGPIIS